MSSRIHFRTARATRCRFCFHTGYRILENGYSAALEIVRHGALPDVKGFGLPDHVRD
jgi:hypothetical protein